MDDEKHRWFGSRYRCKRQDDSFSDAPHAADAAARDCLERWINGPQHERTEEGNFLECLTDDVAIQRLEIDDDVGQLRQIIF